MAESWPALREELKLYPGPRSRDGAPSWSLHDPVRNLFFSLDWVSFEVLCRWHLASADRIVQAVNRDTALQLELQSVLQVLEFLQQRELVQRVGLAQSGQFAERAGRRQRGWMNRLLHHYLFFRLPLWRPDTWLGRTEHAVALFATPLFAWLTLVALLLGCWQISEQWQPFVATLVDLFSLQGLLAYGLTLICVKFLHELGHAFTAKRFGCHVPTMGIAFLVMFPMAYTDVNEVWKLPDRRRRLLVGAAGILTELTLAIWATLAWALLPEGLLRNAAFLVATTTWVSTLLINASPFLRFDGYFLLMDWLGLPNLHARSFALARWWLREVLFDLRVAAPEVFPPGRQRLLILFAWLVWLYRLVLFAGIAVLVYLMFPKPLGPFLAGVEILWFILRPIGMELRVWGEMREVIKKRARTRLSLIVLAMFGVLLLLPWDPRVHTQALLRPQQSLPLIALGDARITALHYPSGTDVTTGQRLANLVAPDLEYQRRAIESRLDGLRWQRDNSTLQPELRDQQSVIQAQIEQARAELAGIDESLQQFQLVAPQRGVLHWSSPDLQVGQWVADRDTLGVVISQARWQVDAYLPEAELDRIQVGDRARFFAESGYMAPLSLRVSRIDTDATRVLDARVLASIHGGDLLVREQGGQLIPDAALYRITLDLEQQPAATERPWPEQRGELVILGTSRAWSWHYWRTAWAVIRREAGF